MDLLTRHDIPALSTVDPAETQISLFMPTHRFGDQTQADQLRWKNLVNGVESVLAEQMRRPDIEALLAPARRLQSDAMAWQYMSDGLAMFIRPGWERSFRVPVGLPELGTVGDRLVLGPLLRVLSGNDQFLVLALSQREIRLMEGNRSTLEEVQLADVPRSLREVVRAQGARTETMARPANTATRGGPAVFYGHAAVDDNLKKDEVQRFLREVSAGLHDVLAARSLPLVLVGLPPLVAAYRAVNSYGHVLPDAVMRSSDQLSETALHELAWPLVEERLRGERTKLIELFRELNGTGRVSVDPLAVSEAAASGRIETLLVRSEPWCWELVAPTDSPLVVRLDDDRYADCVRGDATVLATLENGGQVHATSQHMADDADFDLAAIFRY